MKTYGLIGYPVEHSWSAQFFNDKFKRESLTAEYKLFSLSRVNLFPKLILEQPNLSGLNVTIPYKTQIIPFLDDLSAEAAEIGAVNTIVFDYGKLVGHNTDVYGFAQTLKQLEPLKEPKAIVLGTGGSSKAIVYELKKRAMPFVQVSRNPAKNQIGYGEIGQFTTSHNLIINCTPIGMHPNVDDSPSLPYSLLTKEHIVIDLIYNPKQTQLLKLAASQGAKTLNGLHMLHHQALKAWELWQA